MALDQSHDLRAALDAALDENRLLREHVAQLEKMVHGQQARIAELEARLNTNSKNSSKPPSSDGYSKPQPRSRRLRTGRKPGKQPGTPGTHLAQVAVADEVVVHAPPACGGCGGSLVEAEVVQTEARQVFDLPPIRLLVTEHRAEHRRCSCGITTAARFPSEVSAPVQYGPGVQALGVYLGVYQHVPFERTAQMLADCFGASLSTGTLTAAQTACAAGLSNVTESIRQQLIAAPVAHFDETGARVEGGLQWIHSASTDRLTLYTVHPRRGVEGMEAGGVLPDFTGVAVHDGWAAYRHYGSAHGLCNAHHLRELTGAAEQAGQGWATDMIELLVETKRSVDAARADGHERLDPRMLDRYRQRYSAIIDAGHRANPPVMLVTPGRRRPARSKAANLLARLDSLRDDVLRFATDLSVPFDNNLSERDVRMVKLQQKISGCWRSPAGAGRFCDIRSFISTVRKQGGNVLDALRGVFEGHPALPAAAIP
jgi:transposase